MFILIMAVESGPGEEKFELIYTRFKSLLMSKANSILRDYNLAEDAVSEAFIRVYKNLHKIEDPASGRTAAFLVMIVKNVSYTLLKGRRETEDIEELEQASDFDLEDSVLSESAKEELMREIGKLPEDLKTPFLMKYAYDYSLKDIGKFLKITENNAAVRIHRAKSKLQESLKKGGHVYE